MHLVVGEVDCAMMSPAPERLLEVILTSFMARASTLIGTTTLSASRLSLGRRAPGRTCPCRALETSG